VFLGEEIAQRREYSEQTAREIDEEVRAFLDESYRRALSTLEEHREELDAVAQALLHYEEIPGDQVVELVTGEGRSLEEMLALDPKREVRCPAAPEEA
jgi:cell division protease FtsH